MIALVITNTVLLSLIVLTLIVGGILVLPAFRKGGSVWNYTDVGHQYHTFMTNVGDVDQFWCHLCQKKVFPEEMCRSCKV